MQNKAYDASVKALVEDDKPDGYFKAVVAAYNTDSYGDKIVPGAFQKSLSRWQESGNTIPVVWAHQHQDPDSYIGSVTKAEENADGLVIEGVLDIADNPKAKQVYRLLKGGRVNNYSFAFKVNDFEYLDEPDEDGAQTLLKELDLFEAGPCLVGVNTSTHTQAIKSEPIEELPAKADEPAVEEKAEVTVTLTQGDLATVQVALQSIQDALEALEAATGVVDSDDATEGNEKEAQTAEPVKDEEQIEAKSEDEEPSEAKSDEPMPNVPVDYSDAEFELLKLDI